MLLSVDATLALDKIKLLFVNFADIVEDTKTGALRGWSLRNYDFRRRK